VSVFYLTPPFIALMAWLLFDERLARLRSSVWSRKSMSGDLVSGGPLRCL
jgi:hypothetical protein